MAKITRITAQKKKGRVNIFIEGVYTFSVFENALLDFDLFKGREITKEEVEKIKSLDDNNKILATAYNFLSYRPRSEDEVRKKLTQKHSKKVVASIIKKLKINGHINDKAFVDFWLENRAKSRGVALLRYELLKKGVKREIIEQKLSTHEKEKDLNNALTLVCSKNKFKKYEKKEARQKISAYLARRGYGYDIIKEVLKKLYDQET